MGGAAVFWSPVELQRRLADERRKCRRRASKQCTEPVERVSEARGGTTASSSGGEAAAGVGGDGFDPGGQR